MRRCVDPTKRPRNSTWRRRRPIRRGELHTPATPFSPHPTFALFAAPKLLHALACFLSPTLARLSAFAGLRGEKFSKDPRGDPGERLSIEAREEDWLSKGTR